MTRKRKAAEELSGEARTQKRKSRSGRRSDQRPAERAASLGRLTRAAARQAGTQKVLEVSEEPERLLRGRGKKSTGRPPAEERAMERPTGQVGAAGPSVCATTCCLAVLAGHILQSSCWPGQPV